MMKDNGGAAFPRPYSERYSDSINHAQTGMTLRDYFAGQYIAGRAAIPGHVDPAYDAELAYRVADAMLAERKK